MSSRTSHYDNIAAGICHDDIVALRCRHYRDSQTTVRCSSHANTSLAFRVSSRYATIRSRIQGWKQRRAVAGRVRAVVGKGWDPSVVTPCCAGAGAD